MDRRRASGAVVKVMLPIMLGGAILWWMYRGFDFAGVRRMLTEEMDWTWMIISFPFGILAQALRGWRWHQTLEPLGEKPRTSISVLSIFLSYASSLIIPRSGEFTRCGVLRRFDGISFPKSLGTVVAERVVDTITLAIVSGIVLMVEIREFSVFFDKTGTSMGSILGRFSPTGYMVTAICGLAALVLLHFLLRRLAFYDKVKATLSGIWQGALSVLKVSNAWLFIALTLGIWACYFLHYYLTFFCFGFMEGLGLGCALATFVIGSIAVVVPTPNGAGPWHFAVKTMLILYGVAEENALYFVLIVHAIQTLLVVALGIIAWIALAFTRRLRPEEIKCKT